MSITHGQWRSERPDDDHARAAGTHHQVVREAARRVGVGALACPACNLPMLLESTIPLGAAIECPFCGEGGAARRFVRLDVVDTPGNAVQLIARLPV